MATEQDKALIDQMSAQQLGAPQQPAQEAPQKAEAESKPTEMEKAQEAVSPSTESDKSLDDSVTYIEVDFDGNKRQLSTQQIKETFNRYRDLNYRHANEIKPLEPAINLVQKIMENARASGKEVSGDDIAQFLGAAAQAYVKNPQMGQQRDPTPDQQGQSVRPNNNVQDALENQIKRWEEENAVELPPMYRDGLITIQQLQAENQQMKQLMQQFMATTQGINQDAARAAMDAEEQSRDAYRTTAANNLDYYQQKYQLPNEEENDFFNFAFERGYTMEDFIDADLTDKIMGDYAAVRQTPEMDRLRAMAERRQAYTGAAQSSPGASGNAPQPNVDQQFMNQVAEAAMRKRNMM